jgi:multiple sugar transport system substrate-binding protein
MKRKNRKRAKNISILAVILVGLLALTSPALGGVEIEVGYPYSSLFDVTFNRIYPLFQKAHPDIDVKFRATYDNYEDGTNTVLREAVADKLPDVTFQGLNRQAMLVEKGIAKSLESFIAKEKDLSKEGYHKAMLDLGTFGGEVYGLPFAVSLPVGYYNMDALHKAGIKDLPKTWDEVCENCEKLHAAGYKNPLFWGWNITGNWFFQALLWSQDMPILKDGKVNFDGPEGLLALETMKKLFRRCKMENLPVTDAGRPFNAGEVVMHFWSTSAVGAIERAKGNFELRTGEFPGLNGAPKGLPAGGNAAMLVSTSQDPKKVEAAWKFIKFCTSGVGAAAVAQTTGYMPPNKAANELLGEFYAKNPNKYTAVRQAALLRDWIAYPGDNSLAITQVMYDMIESIVTGDENDMKALQMEMVEEVSAMLPN